MSFLTISKMVRDSTLIERITACAATLGQADPESVVRPRMWAYVTTDGWAEAYEAAQSPPGEDEEAITDQMILSAVQSHLPPAESPAT